MRAGYVGRSSVAAVSTAPHIYAETRSDPFVFLEQKQRRFDRGFPPGSPRINSFKHAHVLIVPRMRIVRTQDDGVHLVPVRPRHHPGVWQPLSQPQQPPLTEQTVDRSKDSSSPAGSRIEPTSPFGGFWIESLFGVTIEKHNGVPLSQGPVRGAVIYFFLGVRGDGT